MGLNNTQLLKLFHQSDYGTNWRGRGILQDGWRGSEKRKNAEDEPAAVFPPKQCSIASKQQQCGRLQHAESV